MPYRTYRLVLALAFATALLAAPASAAEPIPPGAPGHVEGPEWVSAPVTPTEWDGDIRDLPPVKPWKPGDPVIEIPRRFYADPAQALAHAPFWLDVECDPLVAKQAEFDARRDRAAAQPMGISPPLVNVAGIGYQSLSPPDVAGDVGPNHYIQSINNASGSAVQIYDKTGATIGATFNMVDLGGARPCNRTYGDPIVLYDRLADRWFLLEFTTSSGKGLCVHVSKTSDPVSGGWWNYAFVQPTFPDYPHCGVWSDGYYCTANEGQSPIYVFDRASMLNGDPATQQTFRATDLPGYGFQALTPVTLVGPTAPPGNTPFVAVRHNDDEAHTGSPNPSQDYLDLFTVVPDWTTPANSVFTVLPKVNIAEFNSWFLDYSTFATVPQPTSTSRLDPIREVVLNRANYMNFTTHESIVGTLATNIDPARTGGVVDSGVRWFELRRTPPGSGGWTLFQEGTYGDGGNTKHHLEGSIVMNKAGDLGLGFNVTQTSSPNIFASIKYSGRYSTDAPGVMTQGESDIKLGNAVETSGRWGDYPTMALDPSDDCTFWFTHEYRPSGGWATQIASFKILPAAPAAPSLSGVTASGLTVNWTASAGAMTYDVYRASGASCTGAMKVNGAPVTGTSFTDGGLSCGATYAYTIVGVSPCGSSATGACATATTSACAATPERVPYSVTPTGLTKNDAAGNDLTVTWDATRCASSDYHLLWGYGADVAALATDSPVVSGGKCDIGTSGTLPNWNAGVPDPADDPGAGKFVWFLVVGDDDGSTEASWGLTTAGGERGGTAASSRCGCTAKTTSGSCGTT